MAINFECPACQKFYSVVAELGGKASRCGCGHQFVIPTQSTHANLGSSQPSSQMPLANQAEMNDLSGLASPLRNSMSLSTPAPVTTTYSNTPGWINQPSQNNSKKSLIIITSLMLLLITGGVAIFFLTSRDDGADSASITAVPAPEPVSYTHLTLPTKA